MPAALIGAAQRVEHYEIAAYGTARTFAERLGYEDVAELLQRTVDEEKAADETLTNISEQLLTEIAAMPETEEEAETGNRRSSKGRPKTKRSSGAS